MTKNPLHVDIKGLAGSGKTTVALLLQNVLRAHGAQVVLTGEDSEELPYATEHLFERVQSLKGRLVHIETAQTSAAPTPKADPTLLHETLAAVCETYYRNALMADAIYEAYGEALGGFTGVWQTLIEMSTWLEEMVGSGWADDHGAFPEDVEDITRCWMDLMLVHGRVERSRLHQLVLEHFIRQSR